MSTASDATPHSRAWTCRSRLRPRIRTWRSSGQAGPCRSGQPLKLLYVFLMMIPDTTLTRVLQSDTTGIEMSNMYMGAVPFACLIGILLWVIMVYQGSEKRTLAWFILPYTLFALFGALVYFGGHHIGIALLFFVFWSWITANGDYDHKSESSKLTVYSDESHSLRVISERTTSCQEKINIHYKATPATQLRRLV